MLRIIVLEILQGDLGDEAISCSPLKCTCIQISFHPLPECENSIYWLKQIMFYVEIYIYRIYILN